MYLSLPSKCWGAELHHHTLFVNFACWSRISKAYSVHFLLCFCCFVPLGIISWALYTQCNGFTRELHPQSCLLSLSPLFLHVQFSCIKPSMALWNHLLRLCHLCLWRSFHLQNWNATPILKTSYSSLVQSLRQSFCFQLLQTWLLLLPISGSVLLTFLWLVYFICIIAFTFTPVVAQVKFLPLLRLNDSALYCATLFVHSFTHW